MPADSQDKMLACRQGLNIFIGRVPLMELEWSQRYA